MKAIAERNDSTIGASWISLQMVNAIHDRQSRPDPDIIRLARTAWGWNAQPENLRRMLGLLFQENVRIGHRTREERYQQLFQQVILIRDAFRNLPQGPEIRATTWSGLLRRAREWHRNAARDLRKDAWEKTIQAQGGCYPAWNSLIPSPGELQGLKIRHLGSQKELFQEARRMEHCVHTYTRQCCSGQSRIFSLEKDGRPIATGEIARTSQDRGQGEWQTAQVQGFRNHPPPQEARDAVEELARLHSQAPREEQRTWTLRDEPDQHSQPGGTA